MTPKELEALFETTTQYTEALVGFRNQLMNHGFSAEVAEQIVLTSLQNKKD